MNDVRTWIEIDGRALRHNAEKFLYIISSSTRLMAVIKSNAYGHGLPLIAQQLANSKFQNLNHQEIWFGVDSVVEALRLRREGVKNPLLVLGHTLPTRIAEAAAHGMILTVSNFDALAALVAVDPRPAFHLKIDTGMHRQGFMPNEIPRLIATIKRKRLIPAGIYTHFASTKDSKYTHGQIGAFERVLTQFGAAGFLNLICHAAASSGTLLFPKIHLDMVRVGMGLYGYWPSEKSRNTVYALRHTKRIDKITLKPVLTWKTIIAEVKDVPAGTKIGYDETEAVSRKSKIAVLPIGYWHGYDRGLSGIGEVLIRGLRAKVLGRVSMDMIVVDATGILKVRVGDEVVLIGRQGKDAILADELAAKINTTAYEFLTRLNPLIRRVTV